MHELSIAWTWFKLTVMSRMLDAWTFVPLWLGVLLNTVLQLVFFKALFLKTQSLGGWSYGEIMVLLATVRIIQAFAWGLWVRGGFRRLPRDIEQGSFDTNLVRPMNLRIQFIFNNADLFSLIEDLIVSGMLLWYGLSSIGNSFNWLMYLFMLSLALVLHYSIICIFSAINFWIMVPKISELIDQIFNLGRYPISIYGGAVRWFLTFAIPLACIYSFPARALFGALTVTELVTAIAVTVGFWLVGWGIWHLGVRRYESAQG